MDIDRAEQVLATLIEDLAAIEHERWTHWQANVHARGERQADGSLVVPADLVARWDRQIATAYADLTESEKDMDREQVRGYLPLIARAFAEG